MTILDYKDIAIFTEDECIVVKGDPFRDVSDIIYKKGLVSGTQVRISTFDKTDDGIREKKVLVIVTVP